MIRILLLGADRSPFHECLKILSKNKQFHCVGIVGDSSLHNKAKQIFHSNISFIDSRTRNELKIIKIVKENKVDLLISIQHKWILSDKVINSLPLAFNIHFGKLPDYRGHHTLTHPILNGEKEIETTLHWIIPEVDKGFTAFKKKTYIQNDDTSYSLMQKSTINSTRLFNKLLNYISNNKKIPKIPIKGNGKFYSINSIAKLKRITSLKNFDEADKKARAFYHPPHEPAYIVKNNIKFYILPQSLFQN